MNFVVFAAWLGILWFATDVVEDILKFRSNEITQKQYLARRTHGKRTTETYW